MGEIWKDIKDFEGIYQVSNLGRIKSNIRRNQTNKKTVRILENWEKGKNYPHLYLIKDGKQYKRYIHRLVAEAFLENPKHYRYVNHIDGDKNNPKATNLEWCSQKYNMLMRATKRQDNKYLKSH